MAAVVPKNNQFQIGGDDSEDEFDMEDGGDNEDDDDDINEDFFNHQNQFAKPVQQTAVANKVATSKDNTTVRQPIAKVEVLPK